MKNTGRPRRSEEQPDSPFGEAIKEFLRRQKGLTQSILAEKSAVSPQTLSRMVKGLRLNGINTRVHLRSIIRALCHMGVLYTVEEANDLILKIPCAKELDRRDKDDCALIEELEGQAARNVLCDLHKKHWELSRARPKEMTTIEDIAWSLYVELVTRVSVQPLTSGQGLLREALNSLYTLFIETRKILREAGSQIAIQGEEPFGLLGIQLLNQVLRPFTTKWHPLLLAYEKTRSEEISAYEHEQLWERTEEMHRELRQLQEDLEVYAEIFANIAGIKHIKVIRQLSS